ncbi:YdcF family protein [Staphylococcus taiwanensis]|nr:YdcF family protein [Staphylococcus taiwanensis]
MLTTILSLIVLIILLGVLFNFNKFLNLTVFITTVTLCFLITIINILTMTIPTLLTLIIIIAILGLIIKHSHLFSFEKGRRFLFKMSNHLIHGVLFIAILIYISTIPIPIINGIFLWITMITFSAFFSFVIYLAWSSSLGRITTNNQYDIIMVLGAGIFTERVTPMLADRLNRALEVYQHQKSHCLVLVSGGQGPDEPIPESLAMKRYLVAHGIPVSSIIMEDQSTSTYENFYFSRDMIHSRFNHKPKMLCVTSQFHILRGLRFAQKLNLKMDGIGSHTPYHFFNIALIRDFLALMYQYKLLLTIYFAILFFSSIYVLF